EDARRQSGKPPGEARVRHSRLWFLLLLLLAAGLVALEWYSVSEGRPAVKLSSVRQFQAVPDNALQVVTLQGVGEAAKDPTRKKDSKLLKLFNEINKGTLWSETDVERMTRIVFPPDPRAAEWQAALVDPDISPVAAGGGGGGKVKELKP